MTAIELPDKTIKFVDTSSEHIFKEKWINIRSNFLEMLVCL